MKNSCKSGYIYKALMVSCNGSQQQDKDRFKRGGGEKKQVICSCLCDVSSPFRRERVGRGEEKMLMVRGSPVPPDSDGPPEGFSRFHALGSQVCTGLCAQR